MSVALDRQAWQELQVGWLESWDHPCPLVQRMLSGVVERFTHGMTDACKERFMEGRRYISTVLVRLTAWHGCTAPEDGVSMSCAMIFRLLKNLSMQPFGIFSLMFSMCVLLVSVECLPVCAPAPCFSVALAVCLLLGVFTCLWPGSPCCRD
jgi:hypothetical protein